jgi:hypothetical protein
VPGQNATAAGKKAAKKPTKQATKPAARRLQRRTQAIVAPAIRELDDRFELVNGGGVWTVLKQRQERDGLAAGPGYVSRLETHEGALVVDDMVDAKLGTLNHPAAGGLGAYGHHHARRVPDQFPGAPYNFCWDVTVRSPSPFEAAARVVAPPAQPSLELATLAIEVTLRDLWESVAAVTYRYQVKPGQVRCRVVVRSLATVRPDVGAAFVKEPKVAVSLAPNGGTVAYDLIDVYDRSGGLIRQIDLTNMPDPRRGTTHLGQPQRGRLRFRGGVGTPEFNVTFLGSHGGRWHGAARGIDAWALASEERERLIDEGKHYCLDGQRRLSRRWEVTKFPKQTAVDAMAIGWTGGTGAYDCFCAYRAFGPVGETWGTTLVYEVGGVA